MFSTNTEAKPFRRKAQMFSLLLVLLRGEDRFIETPLKNFTECNFTCTDQYASIVDGDSVHHGLRELFDATDKDINSERCELKTTDHLVACTVHANVVYFFEQRKWINLNMKTEFDPRLWKYHDYALPVYPIMNDLLGDHFNNYFLKLLPVKLSESGAL